MDSRKYTIFRRLIQSNIEKSLFIGKAVILYGARQTGKPTLVKPIAANYSGSRYLNCDEPDVRRALTDKTSTELSGYISGSKLVILDEAQRVKNIGLTLKLMVDNFPKVQILATGSSSFDLSNKIVEPLTGRAFEFFLPPLSVWETGIADPLEINRSIETRLIYGLYPEIVAKPSQKEQLLKLIFKNYLYKDVLEYQGIKNPDLLEKLLTALALQIGQEVSFTELAATLGVDKTTVSTYIRILEQAFIIFRLPPLARNLRKEISKSRKIYFWDVGVRNAVVNNFNPLELRNDTGYLWENFLIAERAKVNSFKNKSPNRYFWRTWDQKEIDYIEEARGMFNAFEIKWKTGRAAEPKDWKKNYTDSSWKIVNRDNYLKDFIAK